MEASDPEERKKTVSTVVVHTVSFPAKSIADHLAQKSRVLSFLRWDPGFAVSILTISHRNPEGKVGANNPLVTWLSGKPNEG